MKRVFTRYLTGSASLTVPTPTATIALDNDGLSLDEFVAEEDLTIIGWDIIAKRGADLEGSTTGYGEVSAELTQSGKRNEPGTIGYAMGYYAAGISNEPMQQSQQFAEGQGITLREEGTVNLHMNSNVYGGTAGEVHSFNCYARIYYVKGIR